MSDGAKESFKKLFTEKPEMFLSMLKMDPGMRNVLEKNPQMEAMLHDPAIVDQMLTMMTDPEAMKEAQRMTDNALNELSDIPGGEAMYERVMSQYYEPLEKEQDNKTRGHMEEADPAMAQQSTIPNLWSSTPRVQTPAPTPKSTSATPSSPASGSAGSGFASSLRSSFGSGFGSGLGSGLNSSLGGNTMIGNEANMDLMARIAQENPQLLMEVGVATRCERR